jgi:peptidoglycan/LPS O-acetylase OafA/YrhL
MSFGRSLSSSLDRVRWMAAGLVVVSHVRPLLWVDHGQVLDRHALWAAFYFLTGFGREAVILFFVVSGLLVGGVTLDRYLRSGHFDGRQYLIARISRIYTVLLPALILGWGLDVLGSSVWGGSGLYDRAPSFGIDSIPAQVMGEANSTSFLRNLLCLQHVLGPVLGTNGPLWSLAYEWWYYMLFGAAMVTVSGRGRLPALALLAWTLMVVGLPTDMLVYGAMWLVGVGLGVALPRTTWRPGRWTGLTVVCAAMLGSRYLAVKPELWPLPTWALPLKDLMLSLAFAVYLMSCARDAAVARPWLSAIDRRLAGFSYSLYLSHFPLMVALAAAGQAQLGLGFRVQPGPQSLMWFLVVTACCYAWAWCFHLLFERRTDALRHALAKRISAWAWVSSRADDEVVSANFTPRHAPPL